MSDNEVYCPPTFFDRDVIGTNVLGRWRGEVQSTGLISMGHNGSNNYGKALKLMREKITDYFMNAGEVTFQYHLMD